MHVRTLRHNLCRRRRSGRCSATSSSPTFPPRYNVAPTQPVPIVRLAEGARSFALVRWGLIPSWVKDPRAFSLLINARGELVIDNSAVNSDCRAIIVGIGVPRGTP